MDEQPTTLTDDEIVTTAHPTGTSVRAEGGDGTDGGDADGTDGDGTDGDGDDTDAVDGDGADGDS